MSIGYLVICWSIFNAFSFVLENFDADVILAYTGSVSRGTSRFKMGITHGVIL